MKIADDQPSGLTALDRPNSYIGRSVPRPNLARLAQGRGQYVSDVTLPRMAHVAFGLFVYTDIRLYFLYPMAAWSRTNFPLRLDDFGTANWTGLAATILTVILLGTSGD